jgi:hypothetical protein
MLNFSKSGGGRPFVRLDGRNGMFSLSSSEGTDPELFVMKDQILVADIKRATQGWLKLQGGCDWAPLEDPTDWGRQPSPDHAQAVAVDFFCAAWPAPQIRQFRGLSKAVTGFVARLNEAAADAPDTKAIAVKIGASRITKIGQGTSAEVDFDVAPLGKWPDRRLFDDDYDEADEADDEAPTTKKSGWDGVSDDEIPF